MELFIRRKLVETLGPGGILGEMVLIDRKPRSASVSRKSARPIDVQLAGVPVAATSASGSEPNTEVVRSIMPLDGGGQA